MSPALTKRPDPSPADTPHQLPFQTRVNSFGFGTLNSPDFSAIELRTLCDAGNFMSSWQIGCIPVTKKGIQHPSRTAKNSRSPSQLLVKGAIQICIEACLTEGIECTLLRR